jgi:mono/diheme cytochrome c family protein
MSASRRKSWSCCLSALVLSGLVLMSKTTAAEPVLEVVIGENARQFARDALLARPDAVDIEVVDSAYRKAMRYRAVPVAALLAGLELPADSVIETVARDGFVAQLPLDLVTNTDLSRPVAWLAIEPADAPWPQLPEKSRSAGPFYIVWTGPTEGTIRSEQWPYQVARLASEPSPAARWPALGVDPALPATHAVRAGQALYVTQCLACHMLNGAGTSTLGPDLNQPMSPTEYLTRTGLFALIRDPKSVRNWPERRMPGFSADRMSDREIDLVIDYLAHMAARRTAR